jgi:hypothetical protein
MSTCWDQITSWKLSRRDQETIYWDVDGLPVGATASVQLEGFGAWYPLVISTDQTRLQILVAGPDYPTPDADLVLTVTSHCEIRVVKGTLSKTLDGGYIELVP